MSKQRLVIEGGSLAEKNMSGVGHTTLNIVKALAANKSFTDEFAITIVVPFNKMQHIASHRLPEQIRIKRLYIPGKIMNGLVRFRLVPYMDLLFGKGVYLFPNFKNWPLLFSKNLTYIHDVYFMVSPEHIEPRNLTMLRQGIHMFIKRADKIVGVSRHAKDEIMHYFPESREKTDYIYNGVDTGVFSRKHGNELIEVTDEYGLKAGEYFLFFSNIEPRKNVANLLTAYEIYCRKTGRRDIALVLIGGMGWGNEDIIARIAAMQKDGYAIIKPDVYVPDEHMPALISGAKALTHPALYEGFGLTPLEAMACGTPIIIGKNSSLPEVVGEAYNKYVNVERPEDIARAMIESDQYPQELIDMGIIRAREFSWRNSAKKLSELLRSL